jgi:hypothetical protein
MIVNEYKQTQQHTNFHPFFNDGWFTGRHLNCFKFRDEVDMRESGDKLGSWEQETLRFNLCGRNSILGER